MKKLINYFKTHKKQSYIISALLCAFFVVHTILNLLPSTRNAYHELIKNQSTIRKLYNYTDINHAINESYLKIDHVKNHPRSSFQTLTLVDGYPIKIYNAKYQEISTSDPTFLTRDKSKIDYANSLMNNHYNFSPNYLKDMLRYDSLEPVIKYQPATLQPLNKDVRTEKRLSAKIYKNLQFFYLSNEGLVESDSNQKFYVFHDDEMGDSNDPYDWKDHVFYRNYPRSFIKYDYARYIWPPVFLADYSVNKSNFWQQYPMISNSIAANFHYHSNDHYGHDFNKTISNSDYITGFEDGSPYPKTKTWPDKYGVSKTNKYIKANEQVFHQECGKDTVTYQQLINYYQQHGSTLPTVNNHALENYNAENLLDVAYNIYIRQLMLNRNFNLWQKAHLAKINYKMSARPLVKSNWYMGSQFLFDSYALEPTKSMNDKCLIGTWFNVYVNADNVKAIDGKPIVETKVNGQLYNSHFKPYHDKLHSYEKYHIAFLDTTLSIKQDKNGVKYVPIKLGCNYAMPLNKTIQKFSYDHYKLNVESSLEDSDTCYYRRVIDPKWRRKADYYNNQTCYIPLSSLKQIAGKPVNQ